MGMPLSRSCPEAKVKTVALSQRGWLSDASLFRKPPVALVSKYRFRAPGDGEMNKIMS